MALHLPVFLSAGAVDAPAGSYGAYTTPTFTPEAGARLFVSALVARAATAVATLSISDSQGHDWQLIGQDGFSPPAGGVSSVALWMTVASGAPMTVTVTPSIAGQLLFQIHPSQVAADAGTPAIVQAGMQRTTAGGSWAVPFPDGAPAAGNAALGWLFAGPQNGGISPAAGSGFTELYQRVSGGQSTGQAQYRMSGAGASIGWAGLTTVAATKYGFVLELAEPEVPPEEHEGAAHVAGGGAVEPAGRKSATGSIAAQGGGIVASVGAKRSRGGVHIAAGGIVQAAGDKQAEGGTLLSGGGGVASAGEKQVPGAARIAGGGSAHPRAARSASGGARIAGGGQITATGSAEEQEVHSGGIRLYGGGSVNGAAAKVVTGGAQVSAGGAVQPAFSKIASGGAHISGGGQISARGSSEEREEHAGGISLRGGGDTSASGNKIAGGAAAVTTGGEVAASGAKQAAVRLAMHGGGVVVSLARKLSGGSVYVAGGGRIRARGSNPDTQPRPPYRAILSVRSASPALSVSSAVTPGLSVRSAAPTLTVSDA